MSYIVLELSQTPGWIKKYWEGEPVCTLDTNVKISTLCRCWKGPDGRTYLEDAAYNVVKGFSKVEEYIPTIPIPYASSLWIVNPT